MAYTSSDRTSIGAVHLTQPHLIDSILQDLRLKKGDSKCKDTPMKSLTILNKSKDSPEFNQSFNYQSVIGKMNYLERNNPPTPARNTVMLNDG